MQSLDQLTANMNWPIDLNELVSIRTVSGLELRIPYQIPVFAEAVSKPAETEIEKLMYLHEWVVQNIEYDKHSGKYFENMFCEEFLPNPVTALKYRKGVCHDMTHVIISAAIVLGLDVRKADIIIDCDGKKVNHCCPIINFNNRDFFIDPAYKKFDVRHRRYTISSELETISEIQSFMAHPYSQKADRAFAKEDYSTAAKYYDACCYMNPYSNVFTHNKSSSYNNLGVLLMNQQAYSEAAELFDKAVQADPSNTSALRNKSSISNMGCAQGGMKLWGF